MGLLKPDFPSVDPATFLERPFMERVRVLGTHWAEHGFGTPKIINLIYVVKVAVLHIALGVTIATLSSSLGVFDIGDWWNQPIVYQKLVLWTMCLEILGFGGSWGPLAGHFKPMTGGFHFWLKPNTIRMAPWPGKVPFTGGDRRTLFDVVLYAAIIVNLVVALLLPAVHDTTLEALRPGSAGLVNPAALFPLIIMVIAIGLRDKVIFLGGRSEQYLPAVVFFAVMPFIDMIVALKLLIVIVWVGAGISKLGHHFAMVIPPMLSNTPWLPIKAIKRAHYRRFPDDMRPSVLAGGVSHVLGTVVEIIAPLVLLFSTDRTLTLCAVVLMVAFHLFIFSTFPLAVPLEWNILFAYAAIFLFMGFPAWDGFGVTDVTTPWAVVFAAAVMLFFPILGNLRPDLVSFLPSMRQYAGNWAAATWALAPGAEEKLEEFVVRGAQNTRTQLLGTYEPDVADVVMHQLMGWRSLHSQGRALISLMQRELGSDIDTYTLREAEFSCNSILGFNFGDGHFHNKNLIDALQRRCGFAPGEFMVAWIESQPIHKGTQEYQVIDAALGIIERGTYRVTDAVNAQPWLPDGPIPFDVHYRADVAPHAGSRFAQASAPQVAPADTTPAR